MTVNSLEGDAFQLPNSTCKTVIAKYHFSAFSTTKQKNGSYPQKNTILWAKFPPLFTIA